MTTITISFDADGTVEYTRTKALTLFGGEGTMERVTDIAKFKHGNLYYINWLMGPYANMAHTCSMATNYNVAIPPAPRRRRCDQSYCYVRFIRGGGCP